MRRLYLLGLLLPLFVAGCGGSGETWQRIERDGVLRVGLDPTYPPFEVDEGGGLRGLDVDLAEALAAELDLTVAYTYLSYDGLYDGLGTGQVDLLLSALVIQPERTRDFSYSDPYFNAGQMLLSTDPATQSIADLEGRAVAVELGSEGHVQAIEWSRRLNVLRIDQFNTPEEALLAAEEGRSAAVLIDAISSGLYLLSHESQLTYRGDPIINEPYAMVVRAEDELLLAKLNEALARLRASGKLDRLIDNHLIVP